MNKLSRTLALAGMMAVAATAVSVAEAQEPKAKTKVTKKAGTVTVKQSPKNDKFYIGIRDADDKYIGQGRPSGYETKEDAVKGLEAIKTALDGAKIEYIKADDKDDDKDEPKKDAKKKSKEKDDDKDEPKKKDTKKKDKDDDKDEPKKDTKKKGG